jgi:hypothetical protein
MGGAQSNQLHPTPDGGTDTASRHNNNQTSTSDSYMSTTNSHSASITGGKSGTHTVTTSVPGLDGMYTAAAAKPVDDAHNSRVERSNSIGQGFLVEDMYGFRAGNGFRQLDNVIAALSDLQTYQRSALEDDGCSGRIINEIDARIDALTRLVHEAKVAKTANETTETRATDIRRRMSTAIFDKRASLAGPGAHHDIAIFNQVRQARVSKKHDANMHLSLLLVCKHTTHNTYTFLILRVCKHTHLHIFVPSFFNLNR